MLKFSDRNEFNYWKKSLEKQNQSLYVNLHGSYKTLNNVVTVYTCQRSGYYTSTGSRKRYLKCQGSKKINGVCPSEMHVRVTGTEEHEVNFV